jgi:hypothetical protein
MDEPEEPVVPPLTDEPEEPVVVPLADEPEEPVVPDEPVVPLPIEGEALGLALELALEPVLGLALDDELADEPAFACWLQASKSAWVWAAACAGTQTTTAARASPVIARVRLAIEISS